MSAKSDRPENNPDLEENLGVASESQRFVHTLQAKLNDGIAEPAPTDPARAVSQVVEQRSASYFSGPQPPPELLAQYEKVCPGWATRLLEMGERQQIHRIECEKEVLALDRLQLEQNRLWIEYSRTGQIMGFAAFLVVASIGVFALSSGKDTIAGICFGTFALGIVGLFLKGRAETPRKDSKGPKPENPD